MNQVLIAPRKYVQGRNTLAEIGSYVKALGKRPLVLWDARVKKIVGKTVLDSFAKVKVKAVDVAFAGDSTKAEVRDEAQRRPNQQNTHHSHERCGSRQSQHRGRGMHCGVFILRRTIRCWSSTTHSNCL